MRAITSQELVFIAGGYTAPGYTPEDEVGKRDIGQNPLGNPQEMNPLIIAALIGAIGAVTAAVVAYFKEPAPVTQTPSKTTVTTSTCEQTAEGDTVCTVTGTVVTVNEFNNK